MSARYGRKLDTNHRAIVATLEAMGCTVETIQGAAGVPDLVVRIFGLERLAEVKPPGEKLNPNQKLWWGKWGREATVLRTAQDCEALVAQMRGLLTQSEVAT